MQTYWECKMVQPPWKPAWQYLIHKYLPYDSVIPLLGIYSREIKSRAHIKTDI